MLNLRNTLHQQGKIGLRSRAPFALSRVINKGLRILEAAVRGAVLEPEVLGALTGGRRGAPGKLIGIVRTLVVTGFSELD